MFSVRREQGRLAELAPVVRVLAADPERGGAVAAGPRRAARRARHGGRGAPRARAGARRRARPVPRRRSGSPRSSTSPTPCAALGDADAAALLYPELAPFAGGNVMIGHLVACYGAADRYLGMLAATLGEAELAESHFERALDLNRAMGAATWLAHTAYEYGRFLRAAARRPRPRGRPARRGRGARPADRDAGAARPGPARSARPRRRRAAGRALPARGADPRARGARA